MEGNDFHYLSKINIELLKNDVRQTFSDFSNILKGFKRRLKQLPLHQICPTKRKSGNISGLDKMPIYLCISRCVSGWKRPHLVKPKKTMEVSLEIYWKRAYLQEIFPKIIGFSLQDIFTLQRNFQFHAPKIFSFSGFKRNFHFSHSFFSFFTPQ